MYGNGLWNFPLIPTFLVLVEVVFTAFRALAFQLLTVTTFIRLAAATFLVLGPHFTSSTDHWFDEPEKVN